MEKATEIFEKHWTKATGKPLDETTKHHMKYAIEAINEALLLGAVSGSLPRHVKFELQKIALADDEMASNPQAGIIYRNTIRDLLEPYCGNDR